MFKSPMTVSHSFLNIFTLTAALGHLHQQNQKNDHEYCVNGTR